MGGSPQEGFKTIASLAGVSVVGKGVGSKDSKQVAAQALLMAFRNGGAVGKLSEEQQANLTKMKNFDFSKAAAPKVEEPASFEQTVVPDNFADKVAPVVAMSQAGINSVQYTSCLHLVKIEAETCKKMLEISENSKKSKRFWRYNFFFKLNFANTLMSVKPLKFLNKLSSGTPTAAWRQPLTQKYSLQFARSDTSTPVVLERTRKSRNNGPLI